MEGDGGFGGVLSLGMSRAGSDDVGGTLDMLSSLSRNGLNILAGGGGGEGGGGSEGGGGGSAGFSLKAMSAAANSWGEGRAKVSGSGFSGFYRAKPAAVAVPAFKEQRLRADVENLLPNECWRLILKLGKRWPAWNKPTSASVPPSPQEKSHDLLATRALEALAQTPDRHGRPPGSKVTRRDPPTPATSSQLDDDTLPVYQPSVSSMDAPKPGGSRTAPLTIFYAGTVKVCEDVPEDKARLIMLFAEKARTEPSGIAPASPSGARPGEDLQLAPPASSHPPAAAASSVLAPSHPSTRPEDSTAAEEMAMPPAIVTSRQAQGPPKPLPNARKSSLARFLDSRKRPKATSGSEGQPSKRHSAASDDAAEDLPGRGKSTKERHNDFTTTDNAEVRH